MSSGSIDDADFETLLTRFEAHSTEELRLKLKQDYLPEISRRTIQGVLSRRGVDEETKVLSSVPRTASWLPASQSAAPRTAGPPRGVRVFSVALLIKGVVALVISTGLLLKFGGGRGRDVELTTFGYSVVMLGWAEGLATCVLALTISAGKEWARLTWLFGAPIVLVTVMFLSAWRVRVGHAVTAVMWGVSVVVLTSADAASYFGRRSRV